MGLFPIYWQVTAWQITYIYILSYSLYIPYVKIGGLLILIYSLQIIFAKILNPGCGAMHIIGGLPPQVVKENDKSNASYE